jgi:TRAP transporter 4TM/12TM fusion protein
MRCHKTHPCRVRASADLPVCGSRAGIAACKVPMASKRKEPAVELLKAETGDIRVLRRHEYYLVAGIAILWAVFQLALAGFLVLDSTKTRAIHLAFGMSLLFLLNPFLKRPGKKLGSLSATDRIPAVDYVLAAAGLVAALYLAIDYEGISTRAGIPIIRDLIAGIILVALLLEAARRTIGPALPIIAVFFTAYAFLGPYMPDVFAFKGVSLRKYLSNITLSTEGIYGIPLGVSASIVYLFVLLGALLDRAGAGKFFTDLALSVLGRYKGGAAKAAVVSSGATGLISGSSIANIVTTGPFTIPLMKKIGYPAKKAAATEVAASTDGQLMPPIMGAAAFIIAEYVNVPYIEVVKAAAIPAFVSYFGLFCITHLEASKLGIKGVPKEDLPSFSTTLKQGLHYLIPIGMLLYELVVLRHSPELAAFRAIMVLFLIIVYQEVRNSLINGKGMGKGLAQAVKIILNGLIRGSKNMIPVALACAAAGIIVGVVNMGIGGMISNIVENLAMGNIFLLLLITAIASLLIGMGLPTTATYIVMASLTAPIIVEVGGAYGFVIPIMAAHLFCFYFGILADDTPPVGLAAYAASAIADSDPIATGIQGFLYDIRTSVIAFMFVFNPDLLLHNIGTWPHALLIFGMALIGMSAFECFAQGWCFTKNKWHDIPFFLAAAFILFHPGAIASFFNLDLSSKYYIFPLGIVLYGLVIIMQKIRMKSLRKIPI